MRRIYPVLAVVLAALVFATAATASLKNSIQPGRTFFGAVKSGNHPVKTLTLHNGTGATQTIKVIGISGSGGYVFTLTSAGTCHVGTTLAPGQTCTFSVRVHTRRVGWFRSVLRAVYANGWNNSAQLEAHVVS